MATSQHGGCISSPHSLIAAVSVGAFNDGRQGGRGKDGLPVLTHTLLVELLPVTQQEPLPRLKQ